MTSIPEIVSPGGSYTKAIIAAKNGADAVYLGVPFTSLRMRQNKLKTFDEIKKTISDLNQMGKRAYLTMNIFPRNKDIKLFESVVEKICNLGADGIIFSDPGTFNIIRKYDQKTPLHLSTQTNILNKESVKFWYDLGVKRIVLARELNIEEIKEIKNYVPQIELEVFVHGAMCISYSGRCLLGEYFSGRDGNKGECSHVCRYNFDVYVKEEKRPDKLFKLKEDNEGSYIFSSKDLCTIEKLGQILHYVDGLKIEGRSKSEWYAGATARVYSHVRDCILQSKKIDKKIKDLLYDIPHRQYWEGFLFNGLENYPDGESNIQSISYDSPGPIKNKTFYGLTYDDFVDIDGKKFFKFVPKQEMFVGDKLETLLEKGLENVEILEMLSSSKKTIKRAHCNMKYIYVNFDKKLQGYEIFFA